MPIMVTSIILLLTSLPIVTQQQQFPAASIEGVVVRIGSGEPIAGVQVTLRRMGGPAVDPAEAGTGASRSFVGPLPPIVTDRDGKFAFKDLAPGQYRITAARNGYVKQDYGQRINGGLGTVVNLEAGRTAKDVVFRLTPAGNVSGEVRDEVGEPITGVLVQLLRSAYDDNGKRTFQVVGSDRTDDRGEYRLYWVSPGRYYLNAGLGNPDQRPAGSSPNEVPVKPYPTVYYPGARDPSEASVIDVLPGMELTSIDFVLAERELHSIRGTVIDVRTGQPARNVEISIAPREADGSFGFSVLNRMYNPANGTFEFRNVAPGSYWIHATTMPDPTASLPPRATSTTVQELFFTLLTSRPAAQIPVDVSGADVENVVLALTPGVSIRGRLSIEAQELSNVEGFRDIQVRLLPTSPNDYVAPPQQMNSDGTFTLDNVFSGEYRVSVFHPQPDIYLKEARFDLADVLDQPLVVSSPETSTLDIVLSAKGGQIDGTLVNEQSQPVSGIQAVLIPDQFRDRVDLYKTAITDQNGHFSIRGIAPGEYTIFAWEAIEQFAYFDQDLVRQFEQKGKPVSISESSRVIAEVKVIPASE